MIMIKKIFIFFVLLTCLIFLGFTSKNIKAVESGFIGQTISISARDPDNYNVVFIYDLGINTSGSNNNDFLRIGGNVFLNIFDDNLLKIVVNGNIVETYNLNNSRLLDIRIVEDTNALYLIIYKIIFNVQETQGFFPQVQSLSRSMITRYQLSSAYYDTWESGDLNISFTLNNSLFYPNFLMNYAFIGYNDSVSSVNTWVNNQLTNYSNYNQVGSQFYDYGYDEGYNDGYDDGEEHGYDDGYSAGESAGYSTGFIAGKDAGLSQGDIIGYNRGYADGENANNAVHPLWGMIRDIAGGIGDILSLQLGPGITIGTIIFVPLFFSALGLILWIWRRN